MTDTAPCCVPPPACSFARHPEVAMLHRWLDGWKGIGLVVAGMERQGCDVTLTCYPQGWRGTLLRREGKDKK
jgi:hypothetical protein